MNPLSLLKYFTVHQEHPFLLQGNTRVQFRDTLRVILAVMDRYRELGVRSESRVAMLAHPSPESLGSLIALLHMGVQVIPLSPRESALGLRRILQEVDCRLILATQGLRKKEFEDLTFLPWLEIPVKQTRIVPIPNEGPDPHAPALILRTSGTSGHPKLAVMSINNFIVNAQGANTVIPFAPGDVWALTLPLYHVGGLGILFRSILDGGAIRLFSPDDSITDILAKGDVSHISLVTTQLVRLLRDPKSTTRLSRMKVVLIGGGPIPQGLRVRCRNLGIPLAVTYGLTEMASQVTTSTPGDPSGDNSTGQILPHRKVRLNLEGEIEVGGDALFLGYFENGIIRDPRNADGYFSTGDLGKFQSGILHVTGRKDHLIISGGENIHPEEVEGVLLSFPHIDQAVVVSVPDPEFGQRPVAYIRPDKDVQINPTDLLKYLRENLPGFKVPDIIYRWPESEEPAGGLKPDRTLFQTLAQKPEANSLLILTHSE